MYFFYLQRESICRLFYYVHQANVDVLAAFGLRTVNGQTIRPDLQSFPFLLVKPEQNIARSIALELRNKLAVDIDLGILIMMD